MQTTLSSNNGVRAIIKENLRRFWPISLVFFLILFCTTVLPVMIMDVAEAPMYVSTRNPMFVIVALMLPILAANAVFRYLYSSSGSTYMHAFPLNRRALFKGSFLSGLILSFAPVFLTMLTVLPIVCYYTIYPGGKKIANVTLTGGAMQLPNAYDVAPAISGWLLIVCVGLLIVFFVYALAVFAAILTGMGSGQVAISFVLNFILVFLCLIVVGYLDTFLIGFDSSSWTDVFLGANPLIYFTYIIYDSSTFFLIPIAIYFVVACLVVFAARALYDRRKLERAGSPICFSSAETAIIWLVTLVSMAGLGIAFAIATASYTNYNKGGLVLGCVIGASVAFMVMTMLTQKTPKVFTLKNLKAFGIFAIVGALFIAFTAFDMTGYTNRVPDPERVKTVKLTFSTYPYEYPYYERYYGIGPFDVEATSAHDIGAAVALHRGALDAEKAYKSGKRGEYGMGSYNWMGRVTLSYKLGGAAKLSRSYGLQQDFTNNETRETLAGMDVFRESATLERLVGYDNIVSVVYSTVGPWLDNDKYYNDRADNGAGDKARQIPDDKIREMAQCMDRDFLRLSAQEIAGTAQPMPEELALFIIEYREPRENDIHGYYTRTFTYMVTSSFSETLDFMKRSIP